MSQSSVSQGALSECLKRCVLTKILNYRRKKSVRARRTKYLPVFTSASAHVSRLSHSHSESPPGLSHYQGVNIALLEPDNFLHNVRREEIVIDITSIYEVNHLIENWQSLSSLLQDETELSQMIEEKLSSQYWEFVKIFSKKVSDQLSLHKNKVNHNIILKEENNLTSSSLYSMLLKQLKLIKIYLKDHLKKSFIVLSDSFYASSVLFAKKSEEKWHFCVDYWKLNTIIKKNRYLLFLIEKTLTWLIRAKIFIKLNVRQAFYWIQMKKSVENLITFCTRYRFYKYKILSFSLCNSSAFF